MRWRGVITRFSHLLRFNIGLVRVIQLLASLLLLCHWVGCLWRIVGEVDPEGDAHQVGGPAVLWAARVRER
eukprot:6752908-Prymnesium_polylepis.1